jgi:predicted secreted Zn-dependent protease
MVPLLYCFSTSAKVNTQVTHSYYEVQANSISKLISEVKKNSPKLGDKNVWAIIKWDLYTEYRFKSVNNQCKLYPVNIEVVADITLPHWVNLDINSSPMKNWWRKYLNFMTLHENSHYENVYKEALIFEQELNNFQFEQNCIIAKQKFFALKHKYIEKVNQRDKQLDLSAKARFYSSDSLFAPLKEKATVVFESGLMNSFIAL